jgi:hypothetical protein
LRQFAYVNVGLLKVKHTRCHLFLCTSPYTIATGQKDCRRGYHLLVARCQRLRPLPVSDVTPRRLAVTDVSGQPEDPIFKCQAMNEINRNPINCCDFFKVHRCCQGRPFCLLTPGRQESVAMLLATVYTSSSEQCIHTFGRSAF